MTVDTCALEGRMEGVAEGERREWVGGGTLGKKGACGEGGELVGNKSQQWRGGQWRGRGE